MVARRLDKTRAELKKRFARLGGKRERGQVFNLIAEVLRFEQEVFEAEMKATRTKYNRDLEERLKAELKEQTRITGELKKTLKERFSRTDFRFIRGVLHSDREVSSEKRDRAFDLFQKLSPLFGGGNE